MTEASEGLSTTAVAAIIAALLAAAALGAQALRGVRREGALEFTLTARPTWWTMYKGQRVAAWTYNGNSAQPISVRHVSVIELVHASPRNDESPLPERAF